MDNTNIYNENSKRTLTLILMIIVSLGIVSFLFWFFPVYTVWQQSMSGQAKLQEAEWSKKILIEEAKAKNESAKLQADAEVIRSRGVAEANKIIGDSLKNNAEYLKYLMIDNMKDSTTSLIYVPTEAGLPILESGRLREQIGDTVK